LLPGLLEVVDERLEDLQKDRIELRRGGRRRCRRGLLWLRFQLLGPYGGVKPRCSLTGVSPMSIRNRIVGHASVRAGDLLRHPLNYRRHPARQRQALADSLDELGDIRSLLGFRLPDGRIQLIDGHLRRDLDPERIVTVELVDLTEAEAVKALLTLDPMAALAETDAQTARMLAASVATASESLRGLWQSLAQEAATARDALDGGSPAAAGPDRQEALEERFMVLVECEDEAQQVELLQRFHGEGLRCKALVS
jgi:hypothetical protein